MFSMRKRFDVGLDIGTGLNLRRVGGHPAHNGSRRRTKPLVGGVPGDRAVSRLTRLRIPAPGGTEGEALSERCRAGAAAPAKTIVRPCILNAMFLPMRFFQWISLMGVCLSALAQSTPQDAKGCLDSKVLTRMPGCFIYSCRSSDFDAAEFPIASNGAKRKVEGLSERLQYHCPPQMSRIQIIRNAQQALKNGGFLIPYQVDGSNWAGVTGQKGPQWVYVESGTGSYQVTTIKMKELDVVMEANADGWAKQIEQSGRASIYGINFDTAKATIRADSEKVLGEVLALLQKNPAWRVAVAGHTDNVGAKNMNLALSRQRAQSVAVWLTGHGIATDRLLPGGFGDFAPVADNATEDGRAKNRRVDLIKLY